MRNLNFIIFVFLLGLPCFNNVSLAQDLTSKNPHKETNDFAEGILKQLKKVNYNNYAYRGRVKYRKSDNYDFVVGKGTPEQQERRALKKALRMVRKKKKQLRKKDQKIDMDIVIDALKRQLKIVKSRISNGEASIQTAIRRPQETAWAIWPMSDRKFQVQVMENTIQTLVDGSYYSNLEKSLQKLIRRRGKIYVSPPELKNLRNFCEAKESGPLQWVRVVVKRFLGLSPGKKPSYFNSQLASVVSGDRERFARLSSLFEDFSKSLDSFKAWLKGALNRGEIRELKYPLKKKHLDAKLKTQGISVSSKRLKKAADKEFNRLVQDRVVNGKTVRGEFNQLLSDYAKTTNGALNPSSTTKQVFDHFRKTRMIKSEAELEKVVKDANKRFLERVKKHQLVTMPKTPIRHHFDGQFKTKDKWLRAGNGVAAAYPGFWMFNKKSPGGPVVGYPSVDKMQAKAPMNLIIDAAENGEAHEAGGHFGQNVALSEIENRNLIREHFFKNRLTSEGWALYFETVVKEKIPRSELANLAFYELWYLIRVMRAKIENELATGKITKEEAIRQFMKYAGLSRASAEAEVNRKVNRRYVDSSYFAGLLELLDLRKRIRNNPKYNYTDKCFNDLVIRVSHIPAKFIEKIITSGENCLTRNAYKTKNKQTNSGSKI